MSTATELAESGVNGPGTELAPTEPGVTIVTGDQLATLVRSEIEAKMTLAAAKPRSVESACNTARTLVKMDREVAAACTYSLPARRGSDEPIVGPSIRFAEILFYAWGNLDVRTRIVGDDGQFAKVQAVALDLERNNTSSAEAVRPIVGKRGRYSLDMIRVTEAALTSIARRDAILTLIPRAIWNPIWRAAMQAAIGGEKTFADERDRYLQRLENRGISRARVFATLGVHGEGDLTYEHLAWLQNLGKQVQDGGISLEEAFPDPAKETAPGTSRSEDLAAKLAAKVNPDQGMAPGMAKEAPKAPEPAAEPPKEKTNPDAWDDRDEWLSALTAAGFAAPDIFKALGVKNRSEMTADHCAKLTEIGNMVAAGKVDWATALGIKPTIPAKGNGGTHAKR